MLIYWFYQKKSPVPSLITGFYCILHLSGNVQHLHNIQEELSDKLYQKIETYPIETFYLDKDQGCRPNRVDCALACALSNTQKLIETWGNPLSVRIFKNSSLGLLVFDVWTTTLRCRDNNFYVFFLFKWILRYQATHQ